MRRIDKLHSMDAQQTAELIFECGIDDQIEFCRRLPECCKTQIQGKSPGEEA